MSPTFKPKQNYIMLEEMEESETSHGGIYIPEKARLPISQGKILAFGPQADQSHLSLGEVVVYPMHTEHRLQIDRKWFILIQDTDVICGTIEK